MDYNPPVWCPAHTHICLEYGVLGLVVLLQPCVWLTIPIILLPSSIQPDRSVYCVLVGRSNGGCVQSDCMMSGDLKAVVTAITFYSSYGHIGLMHTGVKWHYYECLRVGSHSESYRNVLCDSHVICVRFLPLHLNVLQKIALDCTISSACPALENTAIGLL